MKKEKKTKEPKSFDELLYRQNKAFFIKANIAGLLVGAALSLLAMRGTGPLVFMTLLFYPLIACKIFHGMLAFKYDFFSKREKIALAMIPAMISAAIIYLAVTPAWETQEKFFAKIVVLTLWLIAASIAAVMMDGKVKIKIAERIL